jgi:toluene monooxygenase system protein A
VKRDEWLEFARKLDWTYSYVREEDVFPEAISGRPWLPHDKWKNWDDPFRTSYSEYVATQSAKSEAASLEQNPEKLPASWLNALKLHFATFTLAEYAAVIGNLRAARFGRDSAWRNAALLGALDELRHTQIPLSAAHKLLPTDGQFAWTHTFFHTNNWVAIAARHMVDELLLAADPIEFAIGCNFVFETGFTNLEFVGVSAAARAVGDRAFEKMLTSIQSDEARHAQIGPAVMRILVQHDRPRVQYLVDKWFWRSWLFTAIVAGFTLDYLTPLEARTQSFKEFMQEWVIDQYLRSLEEFGLSLPWYWEEFVSALDYYHHMVYASAYTYRATVWFDCVVPGPREREWLADKYPGSWSAFDSVWGRISERWQQADPGNDLAVHGTAIVGFCNLCQLVLSNGTPERNSAVILDRQGKRYIFCSEPCRWIFSREPERYAAHRDVVKRVLAGEAPGNLIALLRYFGLDFDTWGKDAHRGEYPWLSRGGHR